MVIVAWSRNITVPHGAHFSSDKASQSLNAFVNLSGFALADFFSVAEIAETGGVRFVKLYELSGLYCVSSNFHKVFFLVSRCGPDNGCNCVGCQQLDIQARKVSKLTYINSQGCSSFRDNVQDSFYCLRNMTNVVIRAPNFVCDGRRNICRSCRGLNAAWNVCSAFRNLNS